MILSFDIGTTILKGALFSPRGELLQQERQILPGPERQEGVFNEVNPSGWLGALAAMARKFTRERQKEQISALCISGNGPTLICAGENGEPVFPALSWLDRRGTEESKEILEKTGHNIDASFYLPKILWLRKHRRETFNRTRHFLGCPEFILSVLTGVPSNLVTGPLLAEYTWTESLIAKLELPGEKFPADRKPGEILGSLLADPAAEWGVTLRI